MIKNSIVICLLLAFIMQTFNRAVIILNYYTNTAAYVKSCENKAKPMLHCNGHCQLQKKLNQEENKDKQNPERRNDGKDDVLFFSKESRLLPFSFDAITVTYTYFNNKATKDIAADFFHPPGA